MRILAVIAMLFAMLLPAAGQDEPAPWQDQVTGQIEALRNGNAELALSFAGEGFRTQFESNPQAFYDSIMALGYMPIADSRSHSFGRFEKVSDTLVVQVVNFIGEDKGLYEAVYQMSDEGEGRWQVLGVVLQKTAGVAV